MSNNTQDASVIKLLVDAVSDKLQNLSEKINVYIPILNQISKTTDNGIAEINQILYETQNITKTLSTTVSDFYSRTNSLLSKSDDIITKVSDISQCINNAKLCDNYQNIKDKLDDIKKNVPINTDFESKHQNIMSELTLIKQMVQTYNTNVEPIGKFARMISKPVGFLVFVISLIIASYTITNCVHKIVDYASQSKEALINFQHQSPITTK